MDKKKLNQHGNDVILEYFVASSSHIIWCGMLETSMFVYKIKIRKLIVGLFYGVMNFELCIGYYYTVNRISSSM